MRNPNQKNATLLDSLLELQNLDRVPRTGYLLRGIADPESVSEHSFHVALLALFLGPREPGLDVQRAVSMALLHDCAEVRTGDLPRPAATYLPTGAKKTMEAAVFKDLLAPVSSTVHEMIEEYEVGESIEARFVRGCDRFQLTLKAWHYSQAGHQGLGEFFEGIEAKCEWATLEELYSELRAQIQTEQTT